MPKYAFIVPATKLYQELATVLVNSINKHHDNIDILVIDGKLDKESFPKKNVTFIPMKHLELGEARAGQQYRLEVASVLKEYDGACFLDADMFFVRSIDKYLRAAAGSDILFGVSDCSNIYYGKDYTAQYPETVKREFYDTKTITLAPIIYNPKYHSKIFSDAYDICMKNEKYSDMLAVRLSIINNGQWDNLIVLPAHAWTGIHHSFLKFETMLMEKIEGHIVSQAGEEINMIHGKWNDENWVKSLKTTMEWYCTAELPLTEPKKEWYLRQVDSAINICKKEFKKFEL